MSDTSSNGRGNALSDAELMGKWNELCAELVTRFASGKWDANYMIHESQDLMALHPIRSMRWVRLADDSVVPPE
jgi:hypothetical protein